MKFSEMVDQAVEFLQRRARVNQPRALVAAARQAHNMLSEVYHWFTEGFDTKDLQEAKRLIEALSH
jgi:predicted ATPase